MKMKWNFKKAIAMVLSLCLAISISFFPLWTVETSALTAAEIQSKIDTIKSQSAYKPGNPPPEGEYTRGSGCYAFVNLLCQKIFGHDIPSQKSAMELYDSVNFTKIGNTLSKTSGNLTTTTLANLFSQAQPGDVVQMDYTTYSNEDSRHTMMVYSVHSNGIVFYHAGSSKVYFGKSSGTQPLWGTTGNVLLWNDLMNCLKSSDDGISLYRSTHTHNFNSYIYRWDAHPHYNCYECSCGQVEANTSEPNYVASCEECNHTHNYNKYIYRWDAHPHYNCYECSCGQVEANTSEPNYVASCYECNYTQHYTLSYEAHLGDGNNPPSQTVDAGQTVTLSTELLEYHGRAFLGWQLENDDTLYLPGTQITMNRDLKFFAKWDWESLVPVKYTVYNGHTYLAFDGNYSQDQAQRLCESMGGYLAAISSKEENQVVFDTASSGNRWFYWIGLNDEQSEGCYVWYNGEPCNFINWGEGEPTGGDYENGVIMNCRTNGTHSLGTWIDLRIHASTDPRSDYIYKNLGFVCELEYDITQPKATVSYNGNTYSVYDTSVSWKFAKQLAQELGGHLVTITSEEENKVVTNLIQGNKKMLYWLGATDEGNENQWNWVTNESFDYTNWDAGNEPTRQWGEDYLAICAESTSPVKSPGEWLDVKNMASGDFNSNYYINRIGFVLEKENTEIVPSTNHYGDVNGDGEINAVDALFVLKYSVQKHEFSLEEKQLADVDGNDKIDAVDALWILKKLVGIIQKFPIE